MLPELSLQRREEIIHETIKHPIVADSIEISVLNCQSLLQLGDKSSQPKILGALNDYAKRVANIALSHPANAPDVTDQNWKNKFANSCFNAASQEKSMDYFGKMLKNFLVPKLENGQDDFIFTLIATDIFDNVVQVTNCLSAGYDPALLLMTPQEYAQHQDWMVQAAQEGGTDATYMVPDWPH